MPYSTPKFDYHFFIHPVLRAEIGTIFRPKIVKIFTRISNCIQNLQTLQRYISHTFQIEYLTN